MKRILNFAFLLLSLAVYTTAMAQQVNIYPVPQDIKWGTDIAFNNNVAFTLSGSENADTEAVALLNKRFKIGDNGVEVVIGERGDEAVSEYENLIPQKDEGYYLAISNNKVVIAGNDGSGTYYGVQTFIQIASQTNVMCVTVTDYPSVPQRGLVEGYYGNPYSEANRMSLFKMFGEMKMNTYIYGPKDDVYHRGKWREEYPTEEGKKITEYVNAAKANKVDFVWAIHPGEDIQWNDADRKNIVNKLKAMCKLGVRTFAVFWDDLWGDDGTHGDEQAELMNYIATELAKEYPDVNPLIICPTQYNRGWANAIYLPALGEIMNKDINIMWTGNSVVDMINKSDVEWINNQIKRNAYIWLNYPVSDYCIDHLLMGPTYGNDLDIANMLSGFVSNPMEYAEASKVSLFSIADYTWNMPAYNSDASWEAAIRYIMPKNSEAFHFFCENNVDLGANTHGLRRMNESPEFVEAKKIFDNKISTDRAFAYNAVGEQFNKFVTVAEALLTTEEAPALTSEIEPWILAMKYIGQKGTSIIEMNNALACENPDSFINSYLRYKEYNKAQEALRSRDFEGALRTATPAVATIHVEPFIKETVGTLVAEYKEKYDYKNDIFPAQVLENGTYHIMYNGKYLTNNNKSAGSAPQFLSEMDVIRPQNQEWKISVEPNTGRYKIINLEDSRYLNEKGEFTVSNSTNPYEEAWHTYDITLSANGKYAIRNAGSAGDKFWTTNGTRISTGNSSEPLPDKYIFDIVPMGGKANETLIDENDIYYIMSGNKFLTNDNINGNGGNPIFKEIEEPSAAQEWKIAADINGKNCHKITSNADGRYINEYGVFGTNQYFSDWNSYLLTKMGDEWSIQWTQSAIKKGIKYLIANDDKLVEREIPHTESYTVKIVAKENYTLVKDINSFTIQQYDDFIIADEKTEHIAIYSPDGRLITENKGYCVSTEGLAKGVYIAVATYKGDKASLRFIIK